MYENVRAHGWTIETDAGVHGVSMWARAERAKNRKIERVHQSTRATYDYLPPSDATRLRARSSARSVFDDAFSFGSGTDDDALTLGDFFLAAAAKPRSVFLLSSSSSSSAAAAAPRVRVRASLRSMGPRVETSSSRR